MEVYTKVDVELTPKQIAKTVVDEFNSKEQAELLYYIFGTMFHNRSLIQYDYISKEFEELAEYDHENIVNHMNELFSRVRGVYIDRLKEDIPKPTKTIIKEDGIEDNTAYWIPDTSQIWFTPGGDPVWKCSNCGGGRHVYGIENCNEPKHVCPDCGCKMTYDWGKKYGT